MQDRFKFRFFDAEDEKMYDVKNICFVGEPTVTVDYKPVIKKAIYRGYLIQCTGLKDKNGKLIYEGDVIKIPDDYDTYGMFAGEKREVYFNEGGFRLKPKWDKNSRGNWLEDTKDFEVIGNIYENPELLSEVE